MQYFGLDREGSVLHIAGIKKKRSSLDIQTLSEIDLADEEANVKPLYICKKINDKKKKILTTGLDSRDVIIRSAFVRVKGTKALAKVLPMQKATLSLLQTEDNLAIAAICRERDEGSVVDFHATTKEALVKHLEEMQEINIDPDIVSCKARALTRFACIIDKDLQTAIILHIGLKESLCVLMKGGLPAQTYSIPIGKKKLQNACDNTETAQAITGISEKEFPELYSLLNCFQKQFAKAIMAFTRNERFTALPLLITGYETPFQDLFQFLSLANQSIIGLTQHSSDEQTELELKKYAIPIGLALEALSKDGESLQFREKELLPKRVFKRFAAQAISMALLSVGATVGILFAGNELNSQFLKGLDFQLKTLENAEGFKISKAPFAERLNLFERNINTEAKPFPFFITAPPPSALLNWVYHHPQLGLLPLRKIKYEMESFPAIGQMQDPYLAKAYIEAQTTDLSLSRKIHEYLLQGDEMVDSSKELFWETTEQGFRAVFYLKNCPAGKT